MNIYSNNKNFDENNAYYIIIKILSHIYIKFYPKFKGYKILSPQIYQFITKFTKFRKN